MGPRLREDGGRGGVTFVTSSTQGVAKGPEKKGTTKTRRHKVFSGPAQASPGRQKRLPLCLGVFLVQGFYAFCDSLEGGDGAWYIPGCHFP